MNNASITQQKNCAITVLRVVSMLMIVICHIYKYYDFLPGSSFMGQFFNVGVQIFLIISGFLYGGKIVQSFKSFFWNRIKRVYFPTVVLSMAVVVVKFLINQKPSANTIFIYLLNLQGLVFLDGRFFQSRICEIDILGPLWFCTIIMICYGFVPLLQKYRLSLSSFKLLICVGLVLSVCIYLISGITLFYFVEFIFGYYIGYFLKNNKIEIENRTLCICTIGGLFLQILRLYLKSIFDGTNMYTAYVQISHFALAILIFYVFIWFGQNHSEIMNRVGNTKIIKISDNLSFYIYLTHGIYCMGTTSNMYLLCSNLFIATLLFATLSILSALCLKYTTDKMLLYIDLPLKH